MRTVAIMPKETFLPFPFLRLVSSTLSYAFWVYTDLYENRKSSGGRLFSLDLSYPFRSVSLSHEVPGA